jgi:hypothetical protein
MSNIENRVFNGVPPVWSSAIAQQYAHFRALGPMALVRPAEARFRRNIAVIHDVAWPAVTRHRREWPARR